MTQPGRGRSDFYQVLVFLVFIAIVLIGLVVGGSGAQSGVTATPAATAEATAAATSAPVAPRVFFRVPTDNAIVPPTFTVEMGADGLTVEPAGDIHEGAGHFHILIDAPFIDAGQVVPKDETHLHFGAGQTETELTLTPGDHILRLQFADGAHIALDGDQYRAEIHVTVVEDAPAQSVRFVSPADGATVPTTFDVVMAAAGIAIEPAGTIEDNAGHFHILIDAPFIEAGEVVPKAETHLHFGLGQTTTSLTLTPGTHVLRLQLANGAHIALDGDQYRAEITVNVTANS